MHVPVKTIFGQGGMGNGSIVDVECHLSNSLPNIVIVGFATKSVDEAKERIRAAFAYSNIRLPKKRIAINLAPADVPKEGSSFDLAIAASILQTAQMVPTQTNSTIVIGELGLDGSIRAVRGIIGKILAAKKLGFVDFIIPKDNLAQATLVPHIRIKGLESLGGLFEVLQKPEIDFYQTKNGQFNKTKKGQKQDTVMIEDITGQERAKRALLIAAAGNHNILLSGPPGTGKSMLAKALRSIMPDMTIEEILEVTHMHSLANKDFDRIISQRPVRSPHHSSSLVSIVGGGTSPKPGEISLSHLGILFFDEFPEFSRSAVEALRQPLEDRKISISRAKDTIELPANFTLVATSNPCPCGYYNSNQECTCTPLDIIRYQKRISGPVVDRIDLYVDVEEINHKLLLQDSSSAKETSDNLKDRVRAARKIQYQRTGKLNSQLTSKELKNHFRLSEEARDIFDQAAKQMQLSARGYMRTLRVAHTIADLNQEDKIGIKEITEALQYRRKPLQI